MIKTATKDRNHVAPTTPQTTSLCRTCINATKNYYKFCEPYEPISVQVGAHGVFSLITIECKGYQPDEQHQTNTDARQPASNG